MKRTIVTLPTPTLREQSTIVDPTAPEIRALLADLGRAMFHYNGVGIAACQVGINQRIFLINTDSGVEAFFNGTITSGSPEVMEDEEGCLSVPQVYGVVPRHQWVDFEYDDVNGTHHRIRATDFFARVIQHETDHTNGILFVDRATTFTRGTPPVEPGREHHNHAT